VNSNIDFYYLKMQILFYFNLMLSLTLLFQTGFPFDSEEDSRLPRSSRLQKHLDDIASRHPEFADQLRPEMSGFRTWGPRHRHGSGGSSGIFSSEDDASDNRSQASGGSEASGGASEQAAPRVPEPEDPSRGRNKIPQYGLRNTVDLGGAAQKLEESERNQRSWSAPPDARNNEPAQPKRFVSRIEIQPTIPGVQPAQQPPQQASSPPVYSSSPGKPPMAPKQPASKTAGNVRHIPIFVEGRDEPVLPKDSTDNVKPAPEHFSEFPERHNFSDHFSRPQFGGAFHQQHFGTPPKQQHHSFQSPPQQQPFFSQSPPQQHNFNPHQTTHGFHPQQPQQPAPPQKRPTASQAPPTKRSTDAPTSNTPPPAPAAPPANDPLSKVAAVQKNVDALTEQVAQFTGTSRKDKQYIYLDEMLTRNLIQLDDIETQGKENIRQARKDTIRSIQRAISFLESKAPNDAPKTEENMDVAGYEENDNSQNENETKENLPGDCSVAKETETKSDDPAGNNEQQSKPAIDLVPFSENIVGDTCINTDPNLPSVSEDKATVQHNQSS
jgi:hypothetical protein